ncbi:MAG: GHKL domain-containing protein, partial [Clostridia bacterium]|nr:GHKL domain-containing protein [Clostridia bacterium]
KADKAMHGYGIKSIKTIAQKYDGIAAFTCEDNVFTAKINLRNQQKD